MTSFYFVTIKLNMTLSTIEPKENSSLYWFRGLSHAVLALKKLLCVCVGECVLSAIHRENGKARFRDQSILGGEL